MMRSIQRIVFGLGSHYQENPLQQQRARSLLLIMWVVLALSALSAIPTLTNPTFNFPTQVLNVLLYTVAISLSVGAIILVKRGYLNLAVGVFVALLLVGGIVTNVRISDEGIVRYTISDGTLIFFLLPLVVAGITLGRRGILVTTAALVVLVIVGGIIQATDPGRVISIPSVQAVTDVIQAAVVMVLLAVILVVFSERAQKQAAAINQRNIQQQILLDLNVDLRKVLSETELLERTLSYIETRFPQTQTEIYLLDEQKQLVKGVAGEQQINKTIIRLHQTSTLADAANNRRVVTTTMGDSSEQRSHMNASTGFSAAIPMLNQDDVLIGVVDVQGVAPFSEQDIATLAAIVDDVGYRYESSRTLRRLAAIRQEQEATIVTFQKQLDQYRERNQQNVASIWRTYVEGRGRQALGFDLDTSTLVEANDLPETIETALQSGQLQVEQRADQQVINVPIRFRDYNLGAMSFTVPANKPVNPQQLEVVQTVAERLALALENTRLFEQNRAQAIREQKASEIASQLIGATDVRAVLNLAADQFREALGAVTTRIFIQPDVVAEPLAQPQKETAQS
jgi:GAF domain-containing protein